MNSSYLRKEQLFILLLSGYVAVHEGNLKLNPDKNIFQIMDLQSGEFKTSK